MYNLQTHTGWYVANNIIVHNCRCTALPVTKTWAELGFPDIDGDNPASAVPDAKAWFDDQPETVQRDIMGSRRLDAYRDGRLAWGDMAVRRSTDGWRDSYVNTPVPGR